MKKAILLIVLLAIIPMVNAQGTSSISSQQFEIKIITSIESIVSSGLGRSRLISSNEKRNHNSFTSEQTAEDNTRNKSSRKEIRVRDFEETKLLNFYNIGGIRFQNIAANDALVSSKLTEMLRQGWDIIFISSAVESDGGTQDGNGIFITRYILKRLISI